jgi:hypothetical protein
MRPTFRPLVASLSAVMAMAVLAGCGAPAFAPAAPSRVAMPSAVSGHSGPLVFVTIQARVEKLLPDDTTGLPHQNFVVKTIAPQDGLTLTVNHDTHYGEKVAGLKVGTMLTIRGVTYGKPGRPSGIHWTHHKDKADDAGFIKTADGHVYQ